MNQNQVFGVLTCARIVVYLQVNWRITPYVAYGFGNQMKSSKILDEVKGKQNIYSSTYPTQISVYSMPS